MAAQQRRRGPKPKLGTRENLIQTGLRLIHADGYSASGIQGIVEQAQVPKGSFYTYFASKENFGTEVIEAYAARGLAHLDQFLSDGRLRPLARLEAYFDDRIQAFTESGFTRGCLFGNFSAEAADHSEAIRQCLARQFESLSARFAKCIAEGQETGDIGTQFTAQALADYIWNSWEGSLLRMRVEKSAAPLAVFKTLVFGKILRP